MLAGLRGKGELLQPGLDLVSPDPAQLPIAKGRHYVVLQITPAVLQVIIREDRAVLPPEKCPGAVRPKPVLEVGAEEPGGWQGSQELLLYAAGRGDGRTPSGLLPSRHTVPMPEVVVGTNTEELGCFFSVASHERSIA